MVVLQMYCYCMYKCITLYYMKISKTFRLSEEAVAVLDAQDNATQFLEELLLAPRVPQAPATGGLTKEEVLDLIKSEIGRVPPAQDSSTFVPSPPDPITGYPCCQKQAPCKHWIFNGAESHWKNELTGKIREVV